CASWFHRAVQENAAFVIRVMELGAIWFDSAAHPKENLCCSEHAESRSQEVQPERVPVTSCERGPEGPRGIHAHSRQRCLESDKKRVQCSDEIRRITREHSVI